MGLDEIIEKAESLTDEDLIFVFSTLCEVIKQRRQLIVEEINNKNIDKKLVKFIRVSIAGFITGKTLAEICNYILTRTEYNTELDFDKFKDYTSKHIEEMIKKGNVQKTNEKYRLVN